MRWPRTIVHVSRERRNTIPYVTSARRSIEDESTRGQRETMDDVKVILAISGGSLSPEAERLSALVAAGEITDEEAIAELLRQHS